MGAVASISLSRWKLIKHILFDCETFWTRKPYHNCTVCKVGYRCYWLANDCYGHTSVCNKCYAKFKKELGPEKEWEEKRWAKMHKENIKDAIVRKLK